MKTSKYGFFVPDYIDEADIPGLISLNVEVLEKLLDDIKNQSTSNTNGIYFGDTEPESGPYLWLAPVDSVAGDGEIILNAVDYTGDESKLHVETVEGKLYTVENSAVTQENGETVVTFE